MMKRWEGVEKLQICVGCEICTKEGSGHLHPIFFFLRMVMYREYNEREMDPRLDKNLLGFY